LDCGTILPYPNEKGQEEILFFHAGSVPGDFPGGASRPRAALAPPERSFGFAE
jgi:hypothetical protein